MKHKCVGHNFVQRPKGKKGDCWICYKNYQSKYQRNHQANIRKFFEDYKLLCGCVKCGYKDNVIALQFDHIIPVKNKIRTGFISWKQAKFIIQDKNIQVLCANCHCIKTRLNGEHKKKVV